MKKTVLLIALLFTFATTGLAQTPAEAPQPQPVNKPHLIISNYSLSAKPVEPGSEFSLNLDIYNTSTKKVENLLVSLVSINQSSSGQSESGAQASAGSPFVPKEKGNSFFIGSLASKATAKADFSLVSAPKTNPGLYTAYLELSYVADGQPFTTSQIVGIPVARKANLQIQNINVPETVRAGTNFKISFEAINASDFAVAGVNLSVSSPDLEIAKPTYFIGTLEPGDSDILETTAKANKSAATVKLNLKVTYKDDFNQLKTVVRELDVKVQPEPKLTATPTKKPPKPLSWWQKLVAFIKALLGV